MNELQAVSADAHLEVPPWIWAERLPKAYRDRGPQHLMLPDGNDGWLMEGMKQPQPLSGVTVTGGKLYSQIKHGAYKHSDGLPGTGDADQRVREQQQDGIDAELLFYSAGAQIARNASRELALACVQAYNDYLSDYCSYDLDRLWGLAIIPISGVDDAVAELRRVAHKPGIRGVQLLAWPAGGGECLKENDAFWAAASEEGVTVVGHHNWTRMSPPDIPVEIPNSGPHSERFAGLLTCDLDTPTMPIDTTMQMFLSGVFDRFPDLRILFAETHLGWLPFWLEQIDDRYERHHYWLQVDLPMLPSEYIRRFFRFTFIEDHAAVKLRHEIGVDVMCWSSDFPHSVGDWPYSWEVIERQFADVPDDERRKILALNTAEWMHVITPAEKERLAKEPAARRWHDVVMPRLARRGGPAPRELAGVH